MAISDPGSTSWGGHAGPVRAMALAPNGQFLASGGDDGTGLVRNLDTGNCIRLREHRGRVLSIAWASDGRTLATAGNDGMVQIWAAGTGDLLYQLTPMSGPIHAVAYRPGCAIVVSVGDDKRFRVWDMSGEEPRKGQRPVRAVWAVAFSPDGKTFATCDPDGTVKIIDWTTFKARRMLSGHQGEVRSIAFAPDGASLATGDSQGTVRLWDNTADESPRILDGHPGAVNSLAFAPDGITLASAGDDGTIRIRDTTAVQPQRILDAHSGAVNSLAFIPDGITLASAGDDGTIRICDTTAKTRPRVLTGHSGTVWSVGYAPSGAALATGGGQDGTTRIWDTNTGQQQRSLPETVGEIGQVRGVAYAPDGLIVAGALGTKIWLWDVRKSGEKVLDHAESVESFAFAPDGRTMASGDATGSVRLWDISAEEPEPSMNDERAHSGPVKAVAYAPAGNRLATAGHDGIIWIWNGPSSEQRHRIDSGSPVYALAFTPDGTTLASGHHDGSIRIWGAANGERINRFNSGSGPVYTAAFAPDGRLVYAGEDATVRIWDGSARDALELNGHTGPVRSLACSPDGVTLATVGDASIRIWNLRNGTQIGGTGFSAPRRSGRRLAEVSNDSPSLEDGLSAKADAETLAELIAAISTSPPLAIALIGDWGAGKSSTMLQIQAHIDHLAKMSSGNLGRTSFVSNVRQISFNAWDYCDDRLWCGLVDQIFSELATDPEKSPIIEGTVSTPADRAAIHHQISQLQTEKSELDEDLKRADRSQRPAGLLPGLVSPAYVTHLLAMFGRELESDVHKRPSILLGWTALAAGTLAVWLAWGWRAGSIGAALTVVVAPALTVWRQLHTLQREGGGFTTWLRHRIDRRRLAIDQETAKLKERLALIDAHERLATFLNNRADPNAYRGFRGLLGQVKSDLKTLSHDLALARQEWEDSKSTESPPLERIVLYVDDLDRCPPARVVEMLEAIHLMLTLDLFVVVVAVDARWLIQSLETHYRDMFNVPAAPNGHGTVPRPRGPMDPVGSMRSSPVDDLDKIFQIPYVLARPSRATMASFVRSLLPSEALIVTTDSGRWRGDSTPQGSESRSDDRTEPARGGVGTDQAEPAAGTLTGMDSDRPGTDQFNGRRHGEGTSAGSNSNQGTTVPDLNPLSLQLSEQEIDFMKRLGPLMPTPRAAKRLANLYRLVRIGIPDSDYASFVASEDGGPYQIVQILLAVLAGSPATADGIFRELMTARRDGDVLAVLDRAAGASFRRGDFRARLCVELTRIAEDIPMRTNVTEYQKWCPILARYSMYTRTLVNGPS